MSKQINDTTMNENQINKERVLPSKIIRNDQYHNFILSQILRPFQLSLGFKKTIQDIRYVPFGKNETTVNYFELQNWAWEEDKKEWFDQVIDRLSKCLKACDYSFFPENDFFATTLKRRMLEAGIEDISLYGNK